MRDGRSITDQRLVPGLEALTARQSVTSKQEFQADGVTVPYVHLSANMKIQPRNLIVAARL